LFSNLDWITSRDKGTGNLEKKKFIQEPKYLFNLRKKEHLSVDNSKARQVYQRAFLVDAVVNFTQNISNTQNK
jgi:hypothetical protein